MRRAAVYELLDGGTPFYVGVSYNPTARLHEHKCRGTAPRHATVQIVTWYPSRYEAEEAERRLIAERKHPANSASRPDIIEARRKAKAEAAATELVKKFNAAMQAQAEATRQEIEAMLRAGSSVQAVAKQLKIAPNTVYNHIPRARINALRAGDK